MTQNNNSTNKDSGQDPNKDQGQQNNGTENNQSSDNGQDNDQGQNQDNKHVPLNTFLDQKKINKELKEKLAGYEAKEKEAEEKKLLEEKNYNELIQKKSSETEALKKELDLERRNNKLEKIKNKFSNELLKVNVIDTEDALKLVKHDDLLESDNFDDEIKVRVSELAKNKPYLFKANGSNRSNTENGQPNGNTPPKNGVTSKVDPVISSLAQKFSKI